MRKDHDDGAASTRPFLIVTYGNTTRKERPLDRDVFVLGRGSGCDLALVSPEVAPVHCVLVRTAGGWRLRDCSGRLGTLVNGQSVHDGPLDDEDTLQVGTFTFRLRLPPAERPVAPVAAPLAAREDGERPFADDEELAARRAEVEGQAEALRKSLADLEERVRQIEEDEREIAKRRTTLERDEEELQRLRTRVERDLDQRRQEAETRARAAEEESQRRRQEAES